MENYITRIPDGSQNTFRQLREAVTSALPPGTIEVISYGILGFKKEKVIVWIGAFANHCSLFPGGSVISSMRNELNDLKISKGTVQFPADASIKKALVKKIVKARLAEMER